MGLLGHVLELKTGKSYETLVVQRICEPLMMRNTFITLRAEDRDLLAFGHLADGTRFEHFHLQAMASAGALSSTANDMLLFLAANLGLSESELTPLMKQMQIIRHEGSPTFGRTAMP